MTAPRKPAKSRVGLPPEQHEIAFTRGLGGTVTRRVFPSQAALDAFLAKNDGNITVWAFRAVES